ncbi:hypothetical protein ES703_78395 [subsurface metagenome]
MIIDFHTHVFPPQLKKNRSKYIDSDPCFALFYSQKDAKLATGGRNTGSEGGFVASTRETRGGDDCQQVEVCHPRS